jgi:hypothetical protein
MARYPVISTGTLVLTNAATGPLLLAIEELQAAETEFYNGRRDLVNSYPMKRSDITRAQIEQLYDTHLGSEPWRYATRFSNSGSTLKTGTYGNAGGGIFNSSSQEEFYIEPWGGTPTGAYPTTVGGGFSGSEAFLYDSERGAAWVDLIVKHGYTNGFTRKGGTRSVSITSGAGDGSSTSYATAYEGFGEEPLAYNGRGGLSDFEAHMLKLVGDAYEATVRPALNSYQSCLSSYQGSNGSPTEAVFTPSAGGQQWSGYMGSTGGYNRPGELNAELVRETRGTN